MQYESCNNQITDALDAYTRAAELDPNNVHIKARLQLLRSGQGNGMAGQNSAPLPQDVHPQAYQATGAVGPPGPQWGTNSGPQSQAPGPPAGPPGGWGSRLAEINTPAQPPNPFEHQRERGQIPPPPRGPSPRSAEQMRQYPGPGPDSRQGPPPRRSPPVPLPLRDPRDTRDPRDQHPTLVGPYPGQGQGQGQGVPLPHPPPPQPQGPPPIQRVSNPNYAPGPLIQGSSITAPHGMNGSGPGPLPPFGRGSPRNEVRPILDSRMTSPKPGYPHQQLYPHHPDLSGPSGIEGGAPPPASALAAAEAADRGLERPSSVASKRIREWEDEPPMKKPASDEARARLEDQHHRRPSTPPHEQQLRRSSSEARRAEDTQRRLAADDQRRIEEQRRAEADQRRAEEQRRAEDQRRANENYHPSEAAHHPQNVGMPPNQLPSMQHAPPPPHSVAHTPVYENGPAPPPPPPQPKEAPVEEAPHSLPPPPQQRHELPLAPAVQAPASEPERAARKLDVDEDYDDDGEEDKKGGIVSAPESTSGTGDKQASPGVNGHAANGVSNGVGPTKVEATPA